LRSAPPVATFRPTFVTVAIGANDIMHGVTLDVYRQNLRRILDGVKASGARVRGGEREPDRTAATEQVLGVG
jgi:lysophospholipase L1-like esterase